MVYVDNVSQPSGSAGSNAIELGTQFSMVDKFPPIPGPRSQPVNDDPATRKGCRFAPFDEHLSDLVNTPRWQRELDDHFTNVFRRSVLSEHPIDDMVALALRIIGRPTQAKIRSLARTVYMHWISMQFRSRNTNILAQEIIGLISKMTNGLGRLSVYAQTDSLDELSYLCIEKSRLSLRWYLDVVFHRVLPIPRKNLFMRVMAVVAMISHLFRGGQLRYGAALNSLRHVAASPDAIAIIYALLHELGPTFALKLPGWRFIHHLLAELTPLTVARVPADPLCQLVSAIITLITEWHNVAFTFYHTYPGARHVDVD